MRSFSIGTKLLQLYVTTIDKEKRRRKIFIDYLRNERGATCVAPYSTRATNEAGVSTPLHWEELGKLNSADHYNFSNIDLRLKNLKNDPWADYLRLKQTLKFELV